MRTLLGALVTTMLVSGVARGDGFQMKDGRYASGPVTVLRLSAEQVLTVKTKRVVVLTAGQKAALKRDTGKAPTVLSVYSLKTAGKDCTDFDYNIAIWYNPTRIEVPHAFVMSDREAEAKADEFDSIE